MELAVNIIELNLLFIIFIFWRRDAHVSWHKHVGLRIAGVNSLLSLVDPVDQDWKQVPLPVEPSCQPLTLFFEPKVSL